MRLSKTKIKSDNFNYKLPLMGIIKFFIVIAAMGIVLCFVFLLTDG